MILYDFECPSCGTSEHYAEMDEYSLPCECGKRMKRIISLAGVNRSMDILTDAINGVPTRITSAKQMDALCQKNDCTPSYGKGWW